MSDLQGAESTTEPGLPAVLVPLLKGVIYRDANPKVWSALLRLQTQVASYMSVLGLDLQVNGTEGHAFLRSRRLEDGEEETAPRLIARHQISFYDSLLLALLRKKLAEFDAAGTETRLILKLEQIHDIIYLFLPERNDEAKLRDRLEKSIKRLEEMGFLRKLKTSQDADLYEVLRILKDFVDADWLHRLDELLESYRTHAATLKN